MWRTTLSLLVVTLGLGFACTNAEEDRRSELVERGIDFSEDAFIESAKRGEAETVTLFLEGGMDPNVRSDEGMTALMLAARRGHVNVVSTLLAHDARPNIEDSKGRTALDHASANPTSGAFTALIDAGGIYGSLGE